MPDLLANLNPSQVQAVTTTEGYVRVIAGAGTGKTRALTHRYAYLVNEYGISPSNILCITLTDFLRHITLLRDSDAEDTKDCVKIMTIHTAKGLEFDRVFLVGLTEGIFPSARSMEERKKEALEEERRLCFVAMTRAKNRLWMTESEGFGVKGFSKVPSRFLTDIDPALLDMVGEIPEELRKEQEVQAKVFDKTESTTYTPGDQVRHKAFGEGMVERVDEQTRTYYIRFVNGIRPISFDYQGLSHVF